MAAWVSRRKALQVDAAFDDKINRTAVDAARRKFSPEFMNRIDKSVVFRTLRPEHLQQILEIELGMVQQRILMASAANQFVFNCTPKVKSFLLHEGTDPKYGARHLKRAIERHIVFPLANLVATGQVKLGDFIRIDMSPEGTLTFVKEAENAMVPMLLERYGRGCRSASYGAPRPHRGPPRVWRDRNAGRQVISTSARSAQGCRETGTLCFVDFCVGQAPSPASGSFAVRIQSHANPRPSKMTSLIRPDEDIWAYATGWVTCISILHLE